MTILKQILKPTDKETYALVGSNVRPISVKEQDGKLVLYYESDATPDEIFDKINMSFITVAIVGTGRQRDDLNGYQYINTVMMNALPLVWHCYYKNELSQDV